MSISQNNHRSSQRNSRSPYRTPWDYGRNSRREYEPSSGTIPHSSQSESAVLASFFQEKLAVAIVREKYGLHPDDFFLEPHRVICDAIYHLFERGRGVDQFTVGEELSQRGQLDTAGGPEKLAELQRLDADYTLIDSYVQDLKTSSAKRVAFQNAKIVEEMACNGASPDEITQFLQDTAQEISQRSLELSASSRQRFRIFTPHEFKNRPRPDYLIEGMLVEGSLASLEGEPESYKSFLSIAIASCVATGRAWCGKTTKKGGVIYIAGEGESGVKDRLGAWEISHRTELPETFGLLPEAVQLIDAEDIDELLLSIKQSDIKPKLVILDTLARCMVGGDENSAKDMGIFVAGARRLQTELETTVIIVHHQGKNGKVRGSSSFAGAMDTRIETVRTGNRVTVRCAKQKESEKFTPITLERRIVELDSEGHTSLVFELAANDKEAARTANNEKLELCLSILQNSNGPMKSTEWQIESAKHGISRTQFYILKNELYESGRIAQTNGAFHGKGES